MTGIFELSFLGGKVLKASLATVRGRPSSDAPRLKRLMLDQGELSHLWDGERPISYIAFVELRSGTMRGNHYHKVKDELFYVISGDAILLMADIESGLREAVPLCAGDLVHIPTGVAHTFQVVVGGQALEFSPARFDAGDVYPFSLAQT